jgi:hypothetical protein
MNSHDDRRIVEVIDSLYNPADRAVAKRADRGVEFDIVHCLAILDLFQSLFDNVAMG